MDALYSDNGLNRHRIVIQNGHFDCKIFWAKVVCSENEPLFTKYTKHTFYEIEYALEGKMELILRGNRRLILEDGEFTLIPPDCYHQFADCDPVGARFIMAFSMESGDERLAELSALFPEPQAFRESQGLKNLLMMILEHSKDSSEYGERLLESLTQSFLLEMLRIMSQRIGAPSYGGESIGYSGRIGEVLDFIRAYNGIGIRVDELAQRFHFSVRHLNRLFREALGKSVKEVIHHEKLKKIEELAISTTLSLGEIAEFCGFADEYAMNRFFKRYELTNLSQYRKIPKRQKGDKNMANLPELTEQIPDLSHFPTPEQLFVFRNWDSVPAKKMAEILSAQESDVIRMAEDMGLTVPQRVNEEFYIRGKVTLIRNNWQLLCYEQLEKLVDLSEDELAFELKENDFLDVKLQNKPAVTPLKYRPLTPAEEEQTRRIKEIVTSVFDPAEEEKACREFDFIKQFGQAKKSNFPAVYGNVLIDGDWGIEDLTFSRDTEPFIRLFEKKVMESYGILLKGGKKKIRLQIRKDSERPEESRDIRIEKDKIDICAVDRVGILRGLVDLLYLMELNHCPSLNEGDYRFDTRVKERIVSPYCIFYSDVLLEGTEICCPDSLLEEYALLGINGIWLHIVMYKITQFPWDPEQSNGWQIRLENLRKLAARAKKYGIKVYLYFNEPRAMPTDFFRKYPDLMGYENPNRKLGTLCTQQEEVKTYLKNSISTICRKVPDLGGFFAITCSENLTNCFSHKNNVDNRPTCPRCSKLSAEKVIGDLLALVADTAKEINPAIDVIAWNWSWNGRILDYDYMMKEFSKHKIKLMCTSEEACEKRFGDCVTRVIDYSISIVGPGEYAQSMWELARKYGVTPMAKVQFNCTWECSSVPFYPVGELIKRHFKGLMDNQISGMFLGWSLGGYPSGMLRLMARRFAGDENPDGILDAAFGDMRETVEKAMAGFSAAFEEFPFSIASAYNGPQQMGPANLLYEHASGLHATMTCYPFDDLYHWRGREFTEEVYCRQMKKVSEGWNRALAELSKNLSEKKLAENDLLREFYEISAAQGAIYESCSLQCEYILARNGFDASEDENRKEELKAVILDVLEREKKAAMKLYRVMLSNSTVGYEATNHYFFTRLSLKEKLINCEELIRRFQAK